MRSIRITNLLAFSFLIAVRTLAGTIVLEGNYQGKNLFIQNPFSDAGVGFAFTRSR
jgi:hypothetical protein